VQNKQSQLCLFENMLQVSEKEVFSRFELDNPWWKTGQIEPSLRAKPKRHYFDDLFQLIRSEVRRAVVLLGLRRVGKTVLVQHVIEKLLNGIKPFTDPKTIAYLSLETPLYSGMALERLLFLLAEVNNLKINELRYIFFDEVQYLPEWERHLKSLVDSFPWIRFVVTGSAAAALKLKSIESGAGRFTHFYLPALTFGEFLDFREQTKELYRHQPLPFAPEFGQWIGPANEALMDYLNFGGYPEAVFSETVQGDLNRFIKSDIIDKVLLRDLPSLYGISDVQELNRLFTMLAYNTGQELSLEKISQQSGVSKPTVSRYLQYLQAAFLIGIVYRVDENAKKFIRQWHFKVYLTNPSMRAAMFAPVDANSAHLSALVETAVYAQLVHSPHSDQIHYARWDQGEVDFVSLSPHSNNLAEAIEVKFSDRVLDDDRDFSGLQTLLRQKKLAPENAILTSKTVYAVYPLAEGTVRVYPTALLLLGIGENIEEARMFEIALRHEGA
jgi:uncharacterized protein